MSLCIFLKPGAKVIVNEELVITVIPMSGKKFARPAKIAFDGPKEQYRIRHDKSGEVKGEIIGKRAPEDVL